jgi:hypothetical protein
MYGAVYVKSAAKLVSLLIFVGWFIVRTFDVYCCPPGSAHER